jgi:uncharacterized protein (DUF4213/DUF364 family)
VTEAILSAVLEALLERGELRADAGDPWPQAAQFDRVTVGDSAILVELAAGDTAPAGLSHRPPEPLPDAGPWTRLAPVDLVRRVSAGTGGVVATGDGDASPGDSEPDDRLTRAVAIATLNALSAPFISWRTGDPMALLDPAVDQIVTVGLFRPAFRKFEDVEVCVIEREAVGSVTTPDSVSLRLFSPAQTERAMAGADVVFVTGSTLVYGGFHRYLAAAPDSATVVCVGATASLLPEALFAVGVDVVAGAEVVDVDLAREAVREGACGTDLHDRGVRKVYAAGERPAGIDLDSEQG